MSYYVFMGMLQLPVAPSKIAVSIRGKNKVINLINEGEASLIKSPGLTTISFDARLPNNRYPWADYNNSLEYAAGNALGKKFLGIDSLFGFQKAEHYLDQFEKYKTTKQPFRFIVSRMGQGFNLLFSTNMLVTLEDYTITEDARRDGIDVTVPVKLRQYKPFGTKTAHMETDENGNQKLVVDKPRETVDKSIPNAVKVTKAACIMEAVRGVAGGSLNWRSIATNNMVGNPVEDVKGKVLKL